MPAEDAYHFSIAPSQFDVALLPPEARDPSTAEFTEAVHRFLQAQFEEFGGSARIAVSREGISVTWVPHGTLPGALDVIISKLTRGQSPEAIVLLELLLSSNPEDIRILYNLGMALSDAGKLDRAGRHLSEAVRLAPDDVNALVAFGVALHRAGKTAHAAKVLQRAVALDPQNVWAHRNLGGCLLLQGDVDAALGHLKTATELDPTDVQAWWGVAQAYEHLRQFVEADRAYRQVVSLDEYGELGERARHALSRLAQTSFRGAVAGQERMDAVMYCLAALETFASMSDAQVKEITFEIAVLGRRGLDTSNPEQKYQLRSLSGRFSGLHLVSYMYVGFKRVAPDADMSFDLSREYARAQELYALRRKKDEQEG
jgi:superkiller protein 3